MPSKANLRIHARAVRNSLELAERSEKSKVICTKLFEIIKEKKAENIFAYIAVGSEVALDSLIEALEKSENKYNIFFPGSMKNGEMNALKPLTSLDFTLSTLGITVPNEERSVIIKPEELDMIIVPLLLFDEYKYRLGQGGGYYDRYLPKAQNALKIGVAFEEQKHEKLPHKPHDFPMDMVITDKKLWI